MDNFQMGDQTLREPSYVNPYSGLLKSYGQTMFDEVQERLDKNNQTNVENYKTQRSNITNDLLAKISSGELKDIGSLPIGNYDTTALVQGLAKKQDLDSILADRIFNQNYKNDQLQETTRYHNGLLADKRFNQKYKNKELEETIRDHNSELANRRFNQHYKNKELEETIRYHNDILAKNKNNPKLSASDKKLHNYNQTRLGEALATKDLENGVTYTKERIASGKEKAYEDDNIQDIAFWAAYEKGLSPKNNYTSYDVEEDPLVSKPTRARLANTNLDNPKNITNFLKTKESKPIKDLYDKLMNTKDISNPSVMDTIKNPSINYENRLKHKIPIADIEAKLAKAPVGSPEEKELQLQLDSIKVKEFVKKLSKDPKWKNVNPLANSKVFKLLQDIASRQ